MSSSFHFKPINYFEDHHRVMSQLMGFKSFGTLHQSLSDVSLPSNEDFIEFTDLTAQKVFRDVAKTQQQESKTDADYGDESWTVVLSSKKEGIAQDSITSVPAPEGEINEQGYESIAYEDLVDLGYAFMDGLPSQWRPRKEPLSVTKVRLEKNSRKAIEEHRLKDPTYVAYSELAENLLQRSQEQQKERPWLFFPSEGVDIGRRFDQEDAHFYHDHEKQILTGIFDGHSGRRVSKFVSTHFPKIFYRALRESDENVHRAFEETFNSLQEMITKQHKFREEGCTAVVCCIDKKNRWIYTATLGDSEANIYRTINGALQSIPLSCVRDWSSRKEALRLAIALGKPEIAETWPNNPQPKYLRYSGINVSRSLGDVRLRMRSPYPTIIHKPKITRQKICVGDVIVLACDGFKDYVPEKEIAQEISKCKTCRHLAHSLVSYAVNQKHGHDNVSVIAIKVTQMTEDYLQALGSL